MVFQRENKKLLKKMMMQEFVEKKIRKLVFKVLKDFMGVLCRTEELI